MKPTRWLAVVFRHLPGDARFYGAGVSRSEYPFEQKGFFEAPDARPELEMPHVLVLGGSQGAHAINMAMVV